MTMQECRADNCSAIIDSHKLFCVKHWNMLPVVAQSKIYELWREYKHNKPGAFEAYQKAIADAVAIISTREASSKVTTS